MKHAIPLILISALALPVAAVLTFILSPFWNWFEVFSGIESIGHSGPAAWCYVVVLAITVSLGWAAWFLIRRKRG